ncbi:hypothetical protein M9458_035193, partial [Cirrhinus mrigala]
MLQVRPAQLWFTVWSLVSPSPSLFLNQMVASLEFNVLLSRIKRTATLTSCLSRPSIQ